MNGGPRFGSPHTVHHAGCGTGTTTQRAEARHAVPPVPHPIRTTRRIRTEFCTQAPRFGSRHTMHHAGCETGTTTQRTEARHAVPPIPHPIRTARQGRTEFRRTYYIPTGDLPPGSRVALSPTAIRV